MLKELTGVSEIILTQSRKGRAQHPALESGGKRYRQDTDPVSDNVENNGGECRAIKLRFEIKTQEA